MSEPDDRVEEIEHTADWAIRVRARDVPELFVGAAQGMFGLLTDLSKVSAARAFEIDLQAIDAETLLIDWLNELLYLAEEHAVVFAEFAIHRLTVSDDKAEVRASVRGGRPAELFKAIKAATFHGVSIRQDVDGFQVELVFDV
ncbi:MAG TPA: archease [Anaerolineae bacterium]|nr:archease [Anaerolineae bacterium]